MSDALELTDTALTTRDVATGHLLHRFLQPTSDRTCKVRISAEVAADDRMVVVTRGISLQRYLKNPIVQLWHDTQSPAVARMQDLQVVGTELHGTIVFPLEGAVPQSDDAYRLVKNGLLSGVSIGFAILKSQPMPNGLLRVTESNLYEISLCNVPMLEDALVYQRSLTRAGKTISAETMKILTAAHEHMQSAADMIGQLCQPGDDAPDGDEPAAAQRARRARALKVKFDYGRLQ